jgi:hypothetical protein
LPIFASPDPEITNSHCSLPLCSLLGSSSLAPPGQGHHGGLRFARTGEQVELSAFLTDRYVFHIAEC